MFTPYYNYNYPWNNYMNQPMPNLNLKYKQMVLIGYKAKLEQKVMLLLLVNLFY